MILSKKALTMAQAREYAKSQTENVVLQDYFKAYCKLSKEKSLELCSEISALNNMKIKEEHLVKIADFLPQDAEDLSKIFNDVSLNEEETNAILGVVKKY
jgi:DNA-directed RNA polymerase subunit F